MNFDPDNQFVAFDLETTGIDPFTARPVSYAVVGPGLECVRLVDPGIPIPPSATAIHGITDSDASNGMPLDMAMSDLLDLLTDVWQAGGIIVGMNVSYDLTIVHTMCKYLHLPTPRIGPVLDVLVLDRHYNKWRKGSRNLGALCTYYGVSLVDAHTAKADAQACLDILHKMRGRYSFNISLKDNALLRGWYQEWLRGYALYSKQVIPLGRYEWPVHSENH
jgi:DNA polymerase III epsilon subunit-like protein